MAMSTEYCEPKAAKAAAGRPAEPAAEFHIERLAFHGAIGTARLPEAPQSPSLSIQISVNKKWNAPGAAN